MPIIGQSSGIFDGESPFENPQGNSAFGRLIAGIKKIGNSLTSRVTSAYISVLRASELQLNSTGAAKVAGLATLVGGTVTVTTTKVVANSVILLTPRATGAGLLFVGTITPGTSFVITSTNGADVRTVGYTIVNPEV